MKKKTCVSAVCLHFFSPPDGSVLVTYTNDEGPIANSSIIDASKLGEQLPSCLFTFLCLHFICLHFFVYISRPIWVSLLCHRGGICSTSTSHLHGIYTVTGESQLFVYIFIVFVYIPKLEGLIILIYYSNNYHGIVYNILNS